MKVGIPLSEVIQSYMNYEERDTMHKYPIYLDWGIEALKDLHQEVGNTKMESINIVDGIAQIPNDCVSVIQISVNDSSGNLIPLGNNRNIYKANDDCGNPTQPQNSGTASSFAGFTWYNTSSQHFRNGEITGNFYGAGGRSTAGEYNINNGEGRIEFSTNTAATSVIIEYISQPQPVNGQFLVHPYIKKPILDYIRWAKIAYKDGYSQGQVQGRFQVYVTSKNWAKMKIQATSVQDILDFTRKHFSMSPKY
tara:strand:+ start:4143 stop:4895 length:753 start_codon:yes stop_codon:yes gene_type:complete